MRWMPHKIVNGVPYDTPILGSAPIPRILAAVARRGTRVVRFRRVQQGDYYGAVNQKSRRRT